MCKLAEQSVQKNDLFNWQLSQKVENQFLPFQLKRNSHQLEWNSLMKFGGWI